MIYNEQYWTERYKTGQIQWDVGDITTPLKSYFDQLNDKSISILIPGCGNAYEAGYLWESGFRNVYVVDLSLEPLTNFSKKYPDFPKNQLLHKDFFDLEQTFDLIIEQTFFCALHPSEREAYVKQMKKLLKKGGKLVGVLFDDPLFDDHPPYGGNQSEYESVIEGPLKIEILERCYNSIKPRKDRELFLKAINPG